MSWRLSISQVATDGVTLLRVTGRLGTASSGDLIEAVNGAIQAGSRRLVLDLSAVDYASSAGLLSLDAVAGRVHVANGALVVCGLTEPVRLALELSGLLPHFEIESSTETAMSKLAAAD
jgi:stage II sporulation protein AA (anti-sigma F factor antagonist)